jgi:hypothetical protein
VLDNSRVLIRLSIFIHDIVHQRFYLELLVVSPYFSVIHTSLFVIHTIADPQDSWYLCNCFYWESITLGISYICF